MTIPYRGGALPIDDELLSAYLDGQVSPDERATVEAAIAADPAVRARVTDLRATVALLRTLPEPAPRRTFILTPEQAAAIRPVRVPWLTRIFPTLAAVSAVAAVLCLALVAGDLATGGFTRKQTAAPSSRPASEAVIEATPRVTAGAAAPATAAAATTAPIPAVPTTAPAAAAANAPAVVGTTAAAVGFSTATPLPAPTTAAGSAIANSAGSQAAIPSVAPVVTPTAVANIQPPPPVTSTPPSGGAVVTKETHRIPMALVRAGEILLALLAVAGVTLALLGRRGARRA